MTGKTEFSGTAALTFFFLKRDRLFILLWILGMAALTISIAAMLSDMFGTDEDRILMAETMKNPAMIAMCGPCYDYENYNNGAMYTQMMLIWCALLWAVMNIFLVIRHTRRDEEEGRLEMIRALPVGRHAVLLSVTIIVLLVNLSMSLVIGFGLYALNIEDMRLYGSLLFGFCIGITGILFAALTFVSAQISSGARAAAGYALGLLGLYYLIRAFGDISMETASLISPLGLICRTEAYVGNRLYPLLILTLVSAILFALGFRLNSKRDIGQGILSAKRGRSHASPLLSGSIGLSLKLLKTTLIAWSVAVFVFGAAYGSIFGDIEMFIDSSDLIKQVLMSDPNGNTTMQFVDTLLVIMSIISTIAVVIIINRLSAEEKRGHIEDLLSRNVSRFKLMGGYILIALIFSVILQILTVIGLWSASYMVIDESFNFAILLKSAMMYVPAMFVFAGLASALIGVIPGSLIIVWIFLGYCFFIDYLGNLLNVPQWMKDMTPFGQVPKYGLGTEEYDITATAVMFGITAVLITIGLIGFRNRDIKT